MEQEADGALWVWGQTIYIVISNLSEDIGWILAFRKIKRNTWYFILVMTADLTVIFKNLVNFIKIYRLSVYSYTDLVNIMFHNSRKI